MGKEHLPCFLLVAAESILLVVLNLLEQRNVKTIMTKNK
jgi:hypothetical protein